MTRIWTTIAATVAALLPARPVAGAERYSGDAYSVAGNVLLYREIQYVYAGGAQRVYLYRCPDGRAFARKQLRETGDAQAPDFNLVDARLGYREGVREAGDERLVYVQRRTNLPEQSQRLRVPADGVIDAGFDAFARRHWDELRSGGTLHLPYLVPSRRTFYHFKVHRIDERKNARTMTIRLEAGSWFAFVLPHIDIRYDIASRRIVHYEGLSNIRGEDGKNYKVRADYPTVASGQQVAQAEVDAASSAPLATSCSAPDNIVSADGHPTVPEVTIGASARNPNR